jgi:hypothetical protein
VTARTEDERLCENTWENGNRNLEVRQYKEAFDAADEDGTMFPLTLHPYVSGYQAPFITWSSLSRT